MRNRIPFILAGALYALSFPFYGKFNFLPFIFISGFIYFKQFLDENFSLKQVLINTLLFSWAYNITGYYWLTFTLQEFGGLYFPFNFLLWQTFSLIIAPQFYIFAILFYVIKRKMKNVHLHSMFLILFSLLWTLIEYFTPQQFPAHFGHPWLQLAPYLKIAQVFGSPIFSFLTILTSLTIIWFVKHKEVKKFEVFVIISILGFNFLSGEIKTPDHYDSINTRFVQANIGNDLKLKSEGGVQLAVNEVISIFEELSHRESTIGDIELTIWPETAYPKYLMTKRSKIIPRDLKNIISKKGGKYFIGTYDLAHFRSTSFEQAYNTAVFINDDNSISETYHKRVLIPFGEGLPFGPFNEALSGLVQNISFFAEGEKFTFFKYDDQTSFISLICYEILFPEYLRSYLNSSSDRPSFMINITNDSWYGPYSEQEQHLFLAKWRSVEFNLPMLRSTNTGISTYILGNGTEVTRLGNFKQGNLDFKLKVSKSAETIFQSLGILSLLILVLIMMTIKIIYLKILPSKDHASL